MASMAVFAILLLFFSHVMSQCMLTVSQSVANSWMQGATTMVQYNLNVVNNGGVTLDQVKIVPYGGVDSYWSATLNGDGTYGFPAWISSLTPGETWAWGLITMGETALVVETSPSCSVTVAESGSVSASGGSSSSGGNPNPTPSSYCSGNPPTYNGLPCATTTRYFDGTTGACGCGVGDSGPYSWQRYQYTAAGSQGLFGAGTWCGAGCGMCYEITPTGDCPTGGPCATSTTPIVVMITNLCPYDSNVQWCPNPDSVNEYGYGAHFDLQDSANVISAMGWNNPVVTYRQVACGSLGSPDCAEAATCQCGTAGCSSGGVASYQKVSNATIELSPFAGDSSGDAVAPSNGKTPLTSQPLFIVGVVAAGVAMISLTIFGAVRFVARRTAARFEGRTEPLLAAEESS